MDEFYNPDNCIQPFADWIHNWFCNEKYTAMAQVIIAIVWGILLSPFSSGLFALVVFIIIYEIMYYLFTHGNEKYYDTLTRTASINASIFGFIIGRTLCQDEILYEGVPEIKISSFSRDFEPISKFSHFFQNLY